MKAVIMAGGKGTRLRPLTSNTPKPMVPLLDRPVMEYTIQLLKKHGITDIAVTIQYLPEAIRNYFDDGSEFGVSLHYFEEETPLGTAGSVKNAEVFLDETFIVISGDALTDFDLSKAIAFHKEKEASATLVLTRVDNPLEFGVVMTDSNGRINRFLEKPSWGEVFSDTVNTGIYILDPEIFRYYGLGEEFDFSKDLFPALMKDNRPLYGYVADGYWSDIGSLEQYRKTQFDMLDGRVQVDLACSELLPGVWVGEYTKIDPTAQIIAPAFIGSNCIIGPSVSISSYSIVGSGTMIMGGATLEHAILWKGNFLDKGVELKGATLCRHVVTRTSASVREGAVLGDNCQVGIQCLVAEGVKVYPNKVVENYTVLKHSLLWGEKASKNMFGQFGVKGICNVDLTTNFANRLSMAFATALPVGAAIGIGHDAAPFAELIADALTSGLHASGISTYPFGAVTSSVARYATCQLDCRGGLYVRLLEGSDHELAIEFLDEEGLPISKGTERKIENAYVQEDHRYITQDKIGKRKSCPDVHAMYMNALLASVNKDLIRAKSFAIMLDYDPRNMNRILPELLLQLGCRVIHLNGITASTKEFAHFVQANGATLGVRFDGNGQQMEFVTEKGTIVQDEQLGILQILIQLQTTENDFLQVPVHTPHIAERLVTQYNRRVIRSKSDVRTIMEGCQNHGYHIFMDGLYTLVHVMQLMALQDQTLSQLIEDIPDFAYLKEKVDCPWSEKGKVMRFLMEENKEQQVELIDGIKIFHEDGWTLILPDSEEPVFQVYANAGTKQAAEDLAHIYTDKILRFRKS